MGKMGLNSVASLHIILLGSMQVNASPDVSSPTIQCMPNIFMYAIYRGWERFLNTESQGARRGSQAQFFLTALFCLVMVCNYVDSIAVVNNE